MLVKRKRTLWDASRLILMYEQSLSRRTRRTPFLLDAMVGVVLTNIITSTSLLKYMIVRYNKLFNLPFRPNIGEAVVENKSSLVQLIKSNRVRERRKQSNKMWIMGTHQRVLHWMLIGTRTSGGCHSRYWYYGRLPPAHRSLYPLLER